ncbi:flagellar biosynthesis repressor FlbT [Paracoccus haematequi]|uniref:Flagellar biosynthesis repressor FlbT n=1 Tax=Paracoccus haematequi TaxID=2491866 RepID=A0A3S4GQ91_9RHOB|nr:flagellar biosynthesis repressor FlbT [Paracoccus haematequi]VDS08336.1 flagellar biosynthesis repressor FlbT [Paracoccus haematequi]
MSGLVLKLAPNERVLINGAVIENGDRRSKIAIRTPNANVLRLKDAIHPDRANTPVARACYIAQLILSGDAEAAEGKRQLLLAIAQLALVFEDEASQTALREARASVEEGAAYPALRRLRELLPQEEQLIQARRQ